MLDFRAAMRQNSTFRTWQFRLLSVFTAILLSRLLSCLDWPCLCFFWLLCRGEEEGEMGGRMMTSMPMRLTCSVSLVASVQGWGSLGLGGIITSMRTRLACSVFLFTSVQGPD